MKHFHVAAGILRDAAGLVLITERLCNGPFDGLWEFPGEPVARPANPGFNAQARYRVSPSGDNVCSHLNRSPSLARSDRPPLALASCVAALRTTLEHILSPDGDTPIASPCHIREVCERDVLSSEVKRSEASSRQAGSRHERDNHRVRRL